MTKGQGKPIRLSSADVREGLRLERQIARAHDLIHVAENEHKRHVEHLRAMYGAPDDWQLRDWLRGFEPPEEAAAEGGHTHG
jgi:hypothetical protein